MVLPPAAVYRFHKASTSLRPGTHFQLANAAENPTGVELEPGIAHHGNPDSQRYS
jgi:hypothetical protein